MNKCPLVLALICLILMATCCGEEENKPSVITINFGANYNIYSSVSHTFFITDSLGKLLDIHEVTTTEPIELKTLRPLKRVNLTSASIYVGDMGESYSFTTLLNVPLDQSYTVSNSVVPTPTAVGSAKVVVSNYQESNIPTWALNFSNGYDHGYGMNWVTSNGTTVTAETLLRESTSEILVSGFKGGLPVYSRHKDVKAGNELLLDFNTFTVYPKLIEFDFPGQTVGRVTGFYQSNINTFGYLLSSIDLLRYTNSFNSKPVLGFIDGYDRYATGVSYHFNQNTSGYYKFGSAPPLSISIPPSTLTVLSSDINQFTFSFSLPYTYRRSFWVYSETSPKQKDYSWMVIGTGGSQKILLPDEIKNKFNMADLSTLQHKGSEFIIRKDNLGYEEFQRNYFNNLHLTDWEYLSYYFPK